VVLILGVLNQLRRVISRFPASVLSFSLFHHAAMRLLESRRTSSRVIGRTIEGLVEISGVLAWEAWRSRDE
jgi:hypothetical protein